MATLGFYFGFWGIFFAPGRGGAPTPLIIYGAPGGGGGPGGPGGLMAPGGGGGGGANYGA